MTTTDTVPAFCQCPIVTPVYLLLPSPPITLPPTQSVAAQEKLSAELDELRQHIASIAREREEHEKVAKSVEDKVGHYY